MSVPLFGLLIIDRDPFVFSDFFGLLQAWLQDAGGFAALGLLAYLLYVFRMPKGQIASARDRASVSGFMLLMAVLAMFTYAGYGALLAMGKGVDTLNVPSQAASYEFVKYHSPKFSKDLQPLTLMLGGLFALLGIGQPFVSSLRRERLQRIWALSKLCYKEAVRSWVFWIYLLILIPFLLPINWFLPTKPEDELRSILSFSSKLMQVLLLLPAGLLAAFAIPNDIKNQNIYTVVSKPVERFEIVLGRFFGYTFLMTIALLGMMAVSLVLIRSAGMDPRAKQVTYKVRVPLRGELTYQSRRGFSEGTNVGREFDYRRYIAGDPTTSQRAVWGFTSLPSRITANRDHVPLEFAFDIFRMTKGEENRGVDLTIRVVSWQCGQRPPTDPGDGTWKWADRKKELEYEEEARELVAKLPGIGAQAAQNPASVLALAKPGTPAWGVVNALSKKYGFYERAGKEIFDYHTESIDVPVGLFESALSAAPPKAAEGQPTTPLVQIYVKCQTRGQMLGMAEGDLYILEGERDPFGFEANYFKAGFGLWCRVTLVIGLAVTCSTYLAGIISFLISGLLFLAGYATEHLADMATGRSSAGGPFRAVENILQAKQPTASADASSALTAPLDWLDLMFSWMVRRFINIVPDVYAYTWTDFLAEGFDVPLECLAMNFVVLLGYLIPWFILGYYLIRSREVAA